MKRNASSFNVNTNVVCCVHNTCSSRISRVIWITVVTTCYLIQSNDQTRIYFRGHLLKRWPAME
jgi:hypothetical protein